MVLMLADQIDGIKRMNYNMTVKLYSMKEREFI